MSEQELESAPRDKAALGADLIIPLLAAGFTIYFLVDSASLVWEARANGTVIGVTLLVMIMVQVARIFLQVRTGVATLGMGEFGRLSRNQIKRLTIIAILAAFVALVPLLGTTLGLFLTTLALMAVLGVRQPALLLGVAAAVAGTVYVLFIAILKTQLPAGVTERLLGSLSGGGG